MSEARTENARTLASLLKLSVEEAAELLDVAIIVTSDPADVAGQVLADFAATLIGRTVSSVVRNEADASAVAELVVGEARATRTNAIRLQVTANEIVIGGEAVTSKIAESTPGVVLLVAACYATGVILRSALGGRLLVSAPALENGLLIPISAVIGNDRSWLDQEVTLSDAYLAGAGAVGNGFVYALTTLRVRGVLVLLDSDTVSDGNLNRCVWFAESDIDYPKATRLAQRAAARLTALTLVPEISTLQDFGKRQPNDRWLKTLIVAVDSRRTRRMLQHEIPQEVFDASTTGIAEIVLHHHRQHTEHACMACIYSETADELSREKHMADTLGITLDEVQDHFVTASTAAKIHEKYPHVAASAIEGQAYDSLFKALCSQGTLVGGDHQQVLAPFGFVSVLAGTFLAIEVCRRAAHTEQATDWNYWRLSPWSPAVVELRQIRSKLATCEFCANASMQKAVRMLWGS